MSYDRKAYLRRRSKIIAYRKRYRKEHPEKIKQWALNFDLRHPGKRKEFRRKTYLHHRNKYLVYSRWYEKHRRKYLPNYKKLKKASLEKWKSEHPLRFALCKRLSIMRQRCKNPNYKDFLRYGGKGIQCHLTTDELEKMWHRDKAEKMKWPSIDRINPDGDYELNNCRFIEFSENVSRASKRRWSKLKTHG